METEPAPRMRTEVQYVHRLNDDRQTAEVFAQLKRAKAQSEALLAYFKAGLEPGASSASWGPWVSTGFLRGYLWKPLVEKGILRQRQVEIGLVSPDLVPPPAPVLNEEQQTALALWKASGDRPFLLFGITGSGKTEVYLHRLREVLAEGKHAVVLLPEVALTEGVLARYRLALGESVHVYHGRVSERQRLDLYRALLHADSPPMVVLAARSGIFLPWNRVGVVVVDEEHDASYKQHEPQPRYHARDVALWLASKFKIPIILGSATPSLESWHRAASGKMVRGTLSRRHGEAPLPKVELVDLAKAQRQGALDGSFTQEVKEAMSARLQDRKQVLEIGRASCRERVSTPV
jgi:primosomal protein N' (replication factor Y)